MKEDKDRRNPFVALCELASKENWCWKLYCTTCGCMYFRYSFLELINGKHPDDADWPIKTRRHHRIDGPIPKSYELGQQKHLLEIVSTANIAEIKRVSKFPDWLGYIGLVLFFCYSYERESRLLTSAFIPQFIELLNGKDGQANKLRETLADPKGVLSLGDLEMIEGAMAGRIKC